MSLVQPAQVEEDARDDNARKYRGDRRLGSKRFVSRPNRPQGRDHGDPERDNASRKLDGITVTHRDPRSSRDESSGR